MKKILFLLSMCLFASTNIFMYCEDGDPIYHQDLSYPMEGGADTLSFVYAESSYANQTWELNYATDYDWHSSETIETQYRFEGQDGVLPDTLECGWFTLVDLDGVQLVVSVSPNTTGKNHYAEVVLIGPYYTTLNIYQDSK